MNSAIKSTPVSNHHIILFGPNGAGKTTHGRFLAGALDRQYTDMSRVLKLGSAYDHALAQEFARYSSNGELVPDEVIFRPLDQYLTTLRPGDFIVGSGVPRLESQVAPFMTILATRLGSDNLIAVDMDLDPEAAVERCRRRAEEDLAVGRNPRPDDMDELLIRKRIRLHNAEKDAVITALLRADARVVTVKCYEDRQQTSLAILSAIGATADDLVFRPEGFK